VRSIYNEATCGIVDPHMRTSIKQFHKHFLQCSVASKPGILHLGYKALTTLYFSRVVLRQSCSVSTNVSSALEVS